MGKTWKDETILEEIEIGKKKEEIICMSRELPAQSSLYISIMSSPDLKFWPDLFGDLKSKSYLVPIQ